MASSASNFEFKYDEDDGWDGWNTREDDGCNETQSMCNGSSDPADWENDEDYDDGGVPLTPTDDPIALLKATMERTFPGTTVTPGHLTPRHSFELIRRKRIREERGECQLRGLAA